MSAIPGYTDAQIEEALEMLSEPHWSERSRPLAACAEAAIRQCQAAIPKPRTEWVPILEALDRVSAEFAPEWFVKIIKNRYLGRLLAVTDSGNTVYPNDDGMVKVLIEDEP